MDPCPPPDQLSALLDGRLQEPALAAAEVHVERCPACQNHLDRLTADAATAWIPPLTAAPGADPGPPPPALPEVPGYAVGAEVGRGGFGVVYAARDIALDRPVALKVLKQGAFADPADRERFLVEARSAARLDHPHIVRVYAVGEAAGVPFTALELAPGGSLAGRFDGTPAPAVAAARLVECLARAVHHAHDHGVVHRDLKPANVLLRTDGWDWPLVADFGHAKAVGTTARPTATAAVLGTPSYMAPEQADGRSRLAGPAADVYALGAILYELLTGRPPFKGETPFDTLLQVRASPPVRPRALRPGLDRDLETVCLKCLEKDPTDRYPTAAALADDLGRFAAGRPVRARRVGPVGRTARWARRHPGRAAGAFVGAVLVVALVAAAAQVRADFLAAREADRLDVLVERLATADPEVAAGVVGEAAREGDRLGPRLRALADRSPPESRPRLNAALALLPADRDQLPFLVDRLLTAPPAEHRLLREALRPYAAEAAARLWPVAEDLTAPTDRQFSAACGLAVLDPYSHRWDGVARDTACTLAAENPLLLHERVEALRPVGRRLVPPLADRFRDPAAPAAERDQAATVLADYAADDVPLLADLACEAGPRAFDALFRPLAARPAEAVAAFTAEHDRRPPADAPDRVLERSAARQAGAAAALARLGRPDAAWDLVRHRPDPTARSYLVHRLSPAGVPVKAVTDRLRAGVEVSARRALILALGEYPPPVPGDGRLTAELLAAYRDDPDPGVHAAIDWLLRTRWGEGAAVAAADRDLAGRPRAGRRWFVDRHGHTFAVIPGPIDFVMGSPPSEPRRQGNETAHRVRIPRSFAVATREVTAAQFRRFLDACPEATGIAPNPQYAPADDCPALRVRWHQAVMYCRWVGEQEDIPPGEQCYPSVREVTGKLTPSPDHLTRGGYRLPTEAEWEFACRAGAATARPFGRGTTLLSHYAWFLANADDASHPIGTLKPNDLGLFDALGNAWEWCGHPVRGYEGAVGGGFIDDGRSADFLAPGAVGLARGGSFLYHAPFVRSAKRYGVEAGRTDETMGFRLARTVAAE